MQTASTGLISALKTSLADTSAGWAVIDVDESSSTFSRVTVATGDGASTDVTITRTRISLAAASIPIATGSKATLRMTYTQVQIDGSYDHGEIAYGHAVYRTTDTALNTTIVALAGPYLTGGDAALTATLAAGPQAGLTIPAELLSAIKTSLASTSAGWQVRGYNRVIMDDGTVQGSIVLNSTAALITIPTVEGTTVAVPCCLSYLFTRSARGLITDAKLMIDGLEWRTLDAALQTMVLQMADAYQTARTTTLTTELANG